MSLPPLRSTTLGLDGLDRHTVATCDVGSLGFLSQQRFRVAAQMPHATPRWPTSSSS